MLKIIFILLFLPFSLYGICRDCDFPYQQYLRHYQTHYENRAMFYGGSFIIQEEDIKTDRERAIFYSGCAYSLESILMMEEKY